MSKLSGQTLYSLLQWTVPRQPDLEESRWVILVGYLKHFEHLSLIQHVVSGWMLSHQLDIIVTLYPLQASRNNGSECWYLLLRFVVKERKDPTTDWVKTLEITSDVTHISCALSDICFVMVFHS